MSKALEWIDLFFYHLEKYSDLRKKIGVENADKTDVPHENV